MFGWFALNLDYTPQIMILSPLCGVIVGLTMKHRAEANGKPWIAELVAIMVLGFVWGCLEAKGVVPVVSDWRIWELL